MSSAVFCHTNGFGLSFQFFDPRSDVVLQSDDALANSTADELVGEQSEPAFHLVDPRGAGRGEVRVEPGVAG